MNGFLDELRDGLRRCRINGTRILVAVSGGADSVALLRGLIQVSPSESLELCVAHFNHRLRGAESDADAKWVGELAASQNLPCEIGIASSSERSADARGLEENARFVRYEFLEKSAALFNCRTIALAHTADDQTETVLHHILRGTGISGLRGMQRMRNTQGGNRLIRPLLTIQRAILEAYLREADQPFRTDSTNTDVAMTRNKIRHLILPLLREQMNPQVDLAIRRLAEHAADIEGYVEGIVDQLLERVLKDTHPDSCRLDVAGLVDQSRYLTCELFREVWKRQKWPQQAMGFDQWNRLAEALHTRETITLPNRIEARYHSGSLLVLRRL